MNRVEKEKLATFTIVDSLIAVAFMVVLAILNMNFNQINPGISVMFNIVSGFGLLLAGLVFGVIAFKKKKQAMLRYSLEAIVYGALLLMFYYSFFRQKIMPNFGFIFYYSLLILGVLYIMFSIVRAIIKVRK